MLQVKIVDSKVSLVRLFMPNFILTMDIKLTGICNGIEERSKCNGCAGFSAVCSMCSDVVM